MTTYTYDNLDRLIEKSNNDGTVKYAYTIDGKILTVTDSTGVTSFTYDLMDGLTRVDYPDGNYVAYNYDNACRLTSVTTPFGSTSYEYDLLDRLIRVVDRNGYATAYEYDKNGNRTKVTYANGYTTTYDYDLLNRLISQKTLDIDGNVVVKYIYILGAAGERLKVEELDRTVEYTYDDLYRLTSETITEGEKVTTYTYAYDNVSNRILKTENGKETEYVYNSLNQLVSDSETSYEYDLNGNLVRVIGAAHSALYEFNAENRLVKATVQNGNNVIEESYTYDYAGNRTSKTTRTNGHVEFVKYLNDNSSLTNVLAEIGSDGTEKCVYTIGADLISQERDGKVSVYIYDGHGSVVALANENGKVTDTYTYDAFGNLLKSTGSTKNCYRYCGEQFDETTGLYYLRARYMDTSTGRFISQDSYDGNINDPISLHKYIYCNSNPVMYTDPTGFSVGGSLSRQMVAIGCFAIICDIVLINYHNVLHSLVDGLIKVADEINNVYIQIEEILIDIRLRINVCFALASRVINESLSNTTLGNLDINFSSLFENVAAYVYWQLLEYGNKYGNDYEHHHIVAKDEPRAFVAQMVFHHVGISVEDKNNLVWVRKAIHKFLHTNEYYFWINREIGEAYFSSLICGDYSASQQYVINKLAILKAMIYGLNILLN